jgi:AcrR family transcriptional regulator
MKTNLREELKAKKQAYVQDEILAAAAALLAKRGARAVTIDDIASSLGYTKSVVYYYFKNKNQVLWEIFNRIHEAWRQDMQAIVTKKLPPERLLPEMIRRHALNVMSRTEWTAIYFRDQAELTQAQQKIIADRKREYDELFKSVYRKGVALKQFKDIPASLMVSSIIGMCNFSHVWFKPTGSLSPDEIADYYVQILMQGCLKNPAKAQDGGRL